MFGKKKKSDSKDGCKCTTKSETQSQEKSCHNTKASDMTRGSRSTKSCSSKATKSYSGKTSSQTKSCKGLSSATTKSCVGKSTSATKGCN